MAKMKLIAYLLAVLVITPATAHAVNIDVVTVGNPGNAPDTHYNGISVGSVDHMYRIGKYEVTAGQYTEFLNAVAKADPKGLYDPRLGDPSGALGANIQRNGSSPNFSYSIATDWGNRPVNWVSFWDAVRFANWLHNGQPTGAQGPGTTEDGAYTLTSSGISNNSITRNAGARFFIPTEDEWYKAAYHDKKSGMAASYFSYPSSLNLTPANTLPDTGNHANFYFARGSDSYTIGPPYYRTEVGAFAKSPSPYGTFDQGGNVYEWNETLVSASTRGLRGGAFITGFGTLSVIARSNFSPSPGDLSLGFRIGAAVPEPSALVLAALASFGLLATLVRRRRLATS